MLNEYNLSDFTTNIWQWYRANSSANVKCSAIHEQVARALTGHGSNTLLGELRTHGGMPLDSTVCQKIADYLCSNNLPELPTSLALWPLPEKFSLTPVERIELWEHACRSALQKGIIDATTHEGFSNVEPYIVPAGSGGWIVCNRSPVLTDLCVKVLAPSKVTFQASNNSLHDDIQHQRHPREAAFHAGLCALRSQDYATALPHFLAAAAQKHAHAHFNAAWMLEQGLGAPTNEHEALLHYREAAAMGSIIAEHNLGMTYLLGNTVVARDVDQARRHFQIAADSGIAASIGHLGDLISTYPKNAEDQDAGMTLLLRAAGEDDPHSLNRLGTIREASGTPDDLDQAFKYYEKAHRMSGKSGNLTPAYNLARCHLRGQGTKQDLLEASRLFKLAADAGDMDAVYNLALMYYEGQVGEQNFATAATLAETAANSQHPAGSNLAGFLYLHGHGVTASTDRAARLFAQAAALGVLEGKFNLAILHMNGQGVVQNHDRAIELLREAAAQGHTKAQQIIDEIAEEVRA